MSLDLHGLQTWLSAQLAQYLGTTVDAIDKDASFADYGLSSRDAVIVSGDLEVLLHRSLSPTLLWEYSTINSLSHYLVMETGTETHQLSQEVIHQNVYSKEPIAIVGIGCRFPGASNKKQFWQLLHNAVDAIDEISPDRWDSAAFYDPDPATTGKTNSRWGGLVGPIDQFEPAFFGISAQEAQHIDPQQRLLMEVAWEALEDAGLTLKELAGSQTGVFIGISTADYGQLQLQNLALSNVYVNTGSAASIAANRLSYLWDLRGPSLAIDTACSSSLVAVHLACRSLWSGEATMALVGGVNVLLSPTIAVNFAKAGAMAADGRCKAFDARADGFVRSEGAGVVALLPLSQATARGYHIYGLIRGSAVNQDGSSNGLMAPNGRAQEAVIMAACADADIVPGQLQYIEAHGTGTFLGDPIEVNALANVLTIGRATERPCALGSVKTNIGHLEAAAGIAGLIKVALSFEHKVIPASLHFHSPNPHIPFERLPLFVQHTTSRWPEHDGPALAGISSFGFGGTNAHVVLEEAPVSEKSCLSLRPYQLLVWSAQTPTALERMTAQLIEHFEQATDEEFPASVYTLQAGRNAFEYRRALVCQYRVDALTALQAQDSVYTIASGAGQPGVAFMFPGQGTQYVGMAADLYEYEQYFRQQVDLCSELLLPLINVDIHTVLYPEPEKADEAQARLQETWLTQPVLFTVQYSVARLWMSWGVHPQALIGHSFGEYVAACIAGVLSLEEALQLVVIRGQLMQSLPAGLVMSLPLPAETVQPLLSEDLSFAAINSPTSCVVSGPSEAIQTLWEDLSKRGIEGRILEIPLAAHSMFVEPIMTRFEEEVSRLSLQPPHIPYISNVTGTWITDQDATDPAYWAKHLRLTVQFSTGIQTLLRDTSCILLDVGPGNTLAQLANQCLDTSTSRLICSSIRQKRIQTPDGAFFLHTLGQLWSAGVTVDWSAFHIQEKHRLVPLPTYPFERQSYWFVPSWKGWTGTQAHPPVIGKKPDIADWFYFPGWKQATPDTSAIANLDGKHESWLLFMDEGIIGTQLAQRLIESGQTIISVAAGAQFHKLDEHHYVLCPRNAADYEKLVQALKPQFPQKIVYCWALAKPEAARTKIETIEQALDVGLYSLLYLTQALATLDRPEPMHLLVLSNNMQDVLGDVYHPEAALVTGPCKVIPAEYPHIRCQSIDIVLPESSIPDEGLIDLLMQELSSSEPEPVVAYRGRKRWLQVFEPKLIKSVDKPLPLLRDGGVYLITGGLGGIGLELAEALAQQVRATLVLISRSAFPARDEWTQLLQTRDASETLSRIRKLQALEDLGAEVLVLQADVANYTQMSDLLAQVQMRFGTIHGVIHSAGVAGGGVMQLKTHAMIEGVVSPKVRGVLVLSELLQDTPLDFLMLCSSQISLLGGVGQVDYCAANAFLDAWSAYMTTQHSLKRTSIKHTISVNWDAWKETGMAVNTRLPAHLQQIRDETLRSAITSSEGQAVFNRILSNPSIQVIVSTQDFMSQFAKNELVQLMDLQTGTAVLPTERMRRPRPQLRNAYIEPQSRDEQKLVEIWQEVLDIEGIGIQDDFFELGGHSLMATQIGTRIRQSLRVELPMRQLFEAHTIIALAAIVAAARQEKQDYSLTIIQPVSRQDTLPSSFAQQRLWFLDQLEPGCFAYNVAFYVEMHGYLLVSVVEQCLYEIEKRHEVLRTTLVMQGKQLVQIIQPLQYKTLALVDLAELPESEQPAALQRSARAEAEQAFDLAQGPLWRATLVRLQAQEHILLLTMHHSIGDRWSIAVLMREFEVLYNALAQGKPSPLVPLSVQYADFAAWQNQWLQGEVLEHLVTYWRKQLAGATALELPGSLPPPTVKTYQGTIHTITIPKELTQQLIQLSHQAETTLFMTLFAAFALLLRSYTATDDIVVGTDMANRLHTETEDLIGFFVNLLVLRVDLSGAPTFWQLLKRVLKMMLDAYAHQMLPFEKLVEALQLERTAGQTPLINVLFVLHNITMPPMQFQNLTTKLAETDTHTAKFNLAVFVTEHPDGLQIAFNYRTDLFQSAEIERMAQRFTTLLSSIVAQPTVWIDALEIVSPVEKQEVLQTERMRDEKGRGKLKVSAARKITLAPAGEASK